MNDKDKEIDGKSRKINLAVLQTKWIDPATVARELGAEIVDEPDPNLKRLCDLLHGQISG